MMDPVLKFHHLQTQLLSTLIKLNKGEMMKSKGEAMDTSRTMTSLRNRQSKKLKLKRRPETTGCREASLNMKLPCLVFRARRNNISEHDEGRW